MALSGVKNMGCRLLLIAKTLFGVFFLSSAQASFEVTPLRINLAPAGSDSQATLRAQNTKQTPLPIETFVVRRTVSEDGEEVRAPADEDFIIFPPQALVEPGGAQAFRVRYVGDSDIETSRLYGIGVREVQAQVPSEEDGAFLGFSFAYIISATVLPEGAEVELSISAIEPSAEGVSFSVFNGGKRHAVLSAGEWFLTMSDGSQHKIESKLDFLGFPILEPGKTRRFTLPQAAYEGFGTPESLRIEFEQR